MGCPMDWALATPLALDSQFRANQNQGSAVANRISMWRCQKAGNLASVQDSVGRWSTCSPERSLSKHRLFSRWKPKKRGQGGASQEASRHLPVNVTACRDKRREESGRKGHINLRKISGTLAGCPWDSRRDKQRSTSRCPRNFLLFTLEKRTGKGIFAGTLAGCPWGTLAGCPSDTRPSRGFSEVLCDIFLCAFSAP